MLTILRYLLIVPPILTTQESSEGQLYQLPPEHFFPDHSYTSCQAGSYSGSAPQVQKPLNHSTDSAGTKWGTYWTSQNDACKYCHGDTKHSATGLGIASVAVGTDMVGGPVGTGTVCASCHNSTDNDYAAIMELLIPDPVAFKPGSNWNITELITLHMVRQMQIARRVTVEFSQDQQISVNSYIMWIKEKEEVLIV